MSTGSHLLSETAPKATGNSLVDLLLHAAERYPESGFISISGEHEKGELLPYPALLDETRRILGGLRTHIRQPGANVVLLLEHARDFIPAFWACVLGGYVLCPMVSFRGDPERWAKHLSHVNTLLNEPLFVCLGRIRNELPETLRCVELDRLRRGTPHLDIYQPKPNDPAILVLTSGSTGNAKAVVLTHRNLLCSMEGKTERQRLTSSDVTLNWISFDHVAALLESHLLPLFVGASQVHVEPAAILAEPLLFLRLIDRFRVTMSFSPNFLFAQINSALQAARETPQGKPLEMDLSCVRHIISGGEAIVVGTGRRFLDLCAPHKLASNALWPAFGMTETCAGAVYSRGFPDSDAGREFAVLGEPIEGLQMRFVDENEVSLPAGQTGELQLRGPMVFSHYHNNPDATTAAFTSDGWFRTGDVGCCVNGRLSLVGRNKDSIIVSGVNYFSSELETALDQLKEIERSFVAAFPTRPKAADTEQLVVVFATSIPCAEEEQLYQLLVAIRNTTVMLWGFRPAIILPLPKIAFPKTSLGKIQRTLLRKRLEAGEFANEVTATAEVVNRQLGPHTPPDDPLEGELAQVFAKMFRIDLEIVSTTASFFDLGGTSLDILKLTQTLERQFGVQQALPIILQNPTVRGLAVSISRGSLREPKEYDPIVPMQVTGKKTPLFCVHPGNGEVLILVNVAKYFVNERPFYALRPSGFNVGEKCFGSFEEMISAYVNAIFRCQGHGPYAIAGYSLGSAIAFEIAKRIRARGERVDFLGCIDGYPSTAQPPPDWIYVATGLAALLEVVTWEKAEQCANELRESASGQNPCEYVLQFASRDRLTELDLNLQKYFTWARVAFAVEKLIHLHETAGTMDKMTVFYSAGLPRLYEPSAWHNLIKQWSRFSPDSKFIKVAGEHYTLMAPKHVATFQDVLRAEVNAALKGR
jgi:acyl-CoA synthetase (AMP-forming)/AMP-acid ligase II/thioesterase domain-containing protein/acyl carrier protein